MEFPQWPLGGGGREQGLRSPLTLLLRALPAVPKGHRPSLVYGDTEALREMGQLLVTQAVAADVVTSPSLEDLSCPRRESPERQAPPRPWAGWAV